MSQVQTLITAEELGQRQDEFGRCELIRGEVIQLSPAFYDHGETAMDIGILLGHYVKQHDLGKVCAAETGFILERDPDTVRAPDCAFIRKDRLPTSRARFLDFPPDLLVEVVSSRDRPKAMKQKVDQWLAFGVQQVWVADPRKRTITVYLPDGTSHIHHEDDTLEPAQIIPGFGLSLTDVFG